MLREGKKPDAIADTVRMSDPNFSRLQFGIVDRDGMPGGFTGNLVAGWCDDHRSRLAPVVERYGEDDVDEPERLHAAGLAEAREGEVGLLRDLQDLHVLATLVQTTWTVILQGAQGLRDRELLEIAQHCNAETQRQLSWLTTRIKTAAPQALIVAP